MKVNYNSSKQILLKEIEDLRYSLKQYQTLLGVCPFKKEDIKGDTGAMGPQGPIGPQGPPGPNPATKTSELINDGEDGINPFITSQSELNRIPNYEPRPYKKGELVFVDDAIWRNEVEGNETRPNGILIWEQLPQEFRVVFGYDLQSGNRGGTALREPVFAGENIIFIDESNPSSFGQYFINIARDEPSNDIFHDLFEAPNVANDLRLDFNNLLPCEQLIGTYFYDENSENIYKLLQCPLTEDFTNILNVGWTKLAEINKPINEVPELSNKTLTEDGVERLTGETYNGEPVYERIVVMEHDGQLNQMGSGKQLVYNLGFKIKNLLPSTSHKFYEGEETYNNAIGVDGGLHERYFGLGLPNNNEMVQFWTYITYIEEGFLFDNHKITSNLQTFASALQPGNIITAIVHLKYTKLPPQG